MGKTPAVLLAALLTVFAVIVGANQQITAAEHDAFTSGTAAQSASEPELSGISLHIPSLSPITPFVKDLKAVDTLVYITAARTPSPPDALLRVLSHEQSQNPCWLRLAETQSKVITANRVTAEAKMGSLKQNKLKNLQSQLLMPIMFSKNLVEGSPPGYFLIV